MVPLKMPQMPPSFKDIRSYFPSCLFRFIQPYYCYKRGEGQCPANYFDVCEQKHPLKPHFFCKSLPFWVRFQTNQSGCWSLVAEKIVIHTAWTTHQRCRRWFYGPPSFTLQWVLHTHRLQLLILTHFMTLLRKSHLLLLCRGLPLTFCPIDGVPCIVFQIAVADNSRIGGKWKKVSTAFIEQMTEWDFVMAQTFALLLPTEITARGKSAKISFVANVDCNFYLKIAIFCSHGNRRELVMQWFVLWR